MESIIQFVQTEKDETIEQLILEKIEQLSKKYAWLIRADVFIKDEKDSNGKGKICEIRLSCPGPRIFASSSEDSFKASVAETIRDLEVQLEKRKSEMNTH